jgi:hypothetical protein
MAETTYSYVAADFADSKLNPSNLAAEIRASAIVTALDRIDSAGGTLSQGVVISPTGVDIVFKDALSSGDKTLLDGDTTGPAGGLIAASDNGPAAATAQEVTWEGGHTQIGMQALQVLNLPDLSSDYVRSWQVTAAAQVTEILDIYIGDDLTGATGKCYLAGGEYRCRTEAFEGSSLNFSMVDRNDTLGLFSTYGLSVTKLSGLTFNNGTIDDVDVGDIAIGGTSGARSGVLSKGADFVGIQFHEATFQDGENITFERAGSPVASLDCDCTAWDEGDFIVIQESLKDEWIEGLDIREIQPGGSKEVPEGLYFRVKVYNAHITDVLRVKVSLTVGRL